MRKFVCISLIIVLLLTSAVLFVACNKEDEVSSTGEFLKDVANVATRPSDFESLASAIPPHRLIWIWMRFARFFGSWRDVQEGCWNLSTANRSKTFAASLKFQMGARSREADFESPSSAIPTHRRM